MNTQEIYKILLNSIQIKQKDKGIEIVWDLLHIWSMLRCEYKGLEDIKGAKNLEIECNKFIEKGFNRAYDIEFLLVCLQGNYFGEDTGYVVNVYVKRLIREP